MKQAGDHTYTLTLTVHNNPGVLVRCAQIFNRRGHNIESLHTSVIHDTTTMSHMTITAYGRPEAIHQITLQLKKLIDVVDVQEQEIIK
jgi:acetolactate synthase-1/3 small subunit